jgi:hypothetical protein
MFVSRCCKANLLFIDAEDASHYLCAKCFRPTFLRAIVDSLDKLESFNASVQ